MKKKTLTAFESVFLGEFVTVLTTANTSTVTQNDDMVQEKSSPLAFEGYLLEIDDLYYYLGVSPKEPSIAVKIDTVLSVLVTDEKSVHEEILDSLGDDPKDSEIN